MGLQLHIHFRNILGKVTQNFSRTLTLEISLERSHETLTTRALWEHHCLGISPLHSFTMRMSLAGSISQSFHYDYPHVSQIELYSVLLFISTERRGTCNVPRKISPSGSNLEGRPGRALSIRPSLS